MSAQPSLWSVAGVAGSAAGSHRPVRTHFAGPFAVPDEPLAQIDQNAYGAVVRSPAASSSMVPVTP